VGLREEVGSAVEPHRAGLEDDRVQADVGRVHALLGAHVADVLGDQVEAAHVERLEGTTVHVRDIALDHPQPIDFEVEGERLERRLPAAVLQAHVAGHLGADVLEVEMDGRAIEGHVGDQTAVQQGTPVDAGHEPCDVGHRRIRVGVLHDRGVVELDRPEPRMDPQRRDRHRVPGEASVHLALEVVAHRLLRVPGHPVGQDAQ
jgi:hypothetical protein